MREPKTVNFNTFLIAVLTAIVGFFGKNEIDRRQKDTDLLGSIAIKVDSMTEHIRELADNQRELARNQKELARNQGDLLARVVRLEEAMWDGHVGEHTVSPAAASPREKAKNQP
jgi:hypothetical protein